MHLVWHRRDLRVHDLPALQAALEDGPTLGVAVLDPGLWGSWSPRRQAWYAANLRALRRAYRDRGSDLLVRRGDPTEVLPDLADDLGAYSVRVTTAHDPPVVARDRRVEAALPVLVYDYPGAYVQEPGTIATKDGDGYRVFDRFSRAWLERELPERLPAPDEIPAPDPGVDPGPVPEVEADVPLPEPGGEAARARLGDWLAGPVARYHRERTRLDGAGASRLSPHLAVGSLSPRVAVRDALLVGGEGARKWVEELVWRDHLADLLARRPRLRQEPLGRRWKDLDRTGDEEAFQAWRSGETGIPAVDAAMRQLQREGWISHRARAVAAQFLAKHLLVDWRWGAEVFRQRLLDADPAQVVGDWQWAAGLGVDAPPHLRRGSPGGDGAGDAPDLQVMDPVRQAAEHDPDGAWLREWVPESGGDPEPLDDAIVDPKASLQRYLERARDIAGGG